MTSSHSRRAGIALSLSVLLGLPLGVVTAGTAGASPLPQLATVGIDLCATTGTTSLPGAPSVPVWGYTDCGVGATITKPGGPTLAFAQDDVVTITLHNNLTVATGLVFPGIPQPPDTVGAAAGGTKTYSFTASKPGTFLYEAALLPNAQYQVAMGLYGALTVTPLTAGKAYADTLGTQHSDFDTSATLVLSEIDPALNTAANPALFNMRTFAPKYGLMNGAVHPNTANIAAAAGAKVLLRYVNAGLKLHSMAALGVHQTVIANDGNELKYPHKIVAETFGPGQTADVIATLASTAPAKYAIYDASLTLHNNGSGAGGMLTFIEVAGMATPAATPITSGVAVSPQTSNGSADVAVSATVASTTAVTGAEFFIDTVSSTPTPMTGTTAVSGTISTTVLAGLSPGTHVVYVHAQNGTGWGPVSSTSLNLDKAGPVTSGLVLNPAITNSASVTLTATGNDTTTGGAVVTAGSYSIDGVGSVSMSTQLPAPPTTPVTAFTTSIPTSGLAPGIHTVAVRTADALGNRGDPTSITLTIDRDGPVATPGSTTASKNPTNGVIGVSSGVPAVRITSTFTDLLSNIAGAEGFIDASGTSGTGFVFTPSDGVWGGQVSGTITDVVYADIPLATIAALSNGNHTIFVHAKDAAGNWGSLVTVTLVVDKTAPTFTGISVSPNPVILGTPIVLTVAGAADVGTGVTGGEYWFDGTTTSVAPGAGTPFNGSTSSIPTGSLTAGSHSVRVRVRDAAGNWSTGTNGVRSATFTVTFADAIFANGFEAAASPWGWSNASTATVARLNRTAASAMVDGFGLQAQGNNTNYVQWNFPTGTAVSTYDAKFLFRPNGNNSTGKDIFTAATSNGGTTVFRVRYRLNGTTPQVQIQVGTSNANTAWIDINGGTATNSIEVVWQSGTSLSLYVNGSTVPQTLTAPANSIGSVRLGSVTNTGNATSFFFDGFSSKRLVSPLFGP